MTITITGTDPCAEHAWRGQKVAIGTRRVIAPAPRCLVTTRNRDSRATDARILQALARLHGKNDITFGVWSEVLRPRPRPNRRSRNAPAMRLITSSSRPANSLQRARPRRDGDRHPLTASQSEGGQELPAADAGAQRVSPSKSARTWPGGFAPRRDATAADLPTGSSWASWSRAPAAPARSSGRGWCRYSACPSTGAHRSR